MSTDILIITLVAVLSILGIAGCIVPALPGPPLNYVALLVVQYRYKCFSTNFLILWTVIVVIAVIADYFLPIWIAKKYGATKYGVWGSIIGMVLGIFFTPIGMVLGMLIGAIAGELIGGNNSGNAVKSGLATFAGTLLSIGLTLVVSVVLSIYLFVELSRVVSL